MGQDVLILLTVVVFVYSVRLYSQTISLVFENTFIKFFRRLPLGYGPTFLRSLALSTLSFRNQGLGYVSLSFLNSGMIQGSQSLGIISGSYLGVCLALSILNLGAPSLILILLVSTLALSFLSDLPWAHRVSRLLFFFILILISFSYMSYILEKSYVSLYVLNGLSSLKAHPLGLIGFSIASFLILKSTFATIGILYLLYLSFGFSSLLVFSGAFSIFLLGALGFMFKSKDSHRETRLVSILNFLALITSGLGVFLLLSYVEISFLPSLWIFSLILGGVSFVFSFFLKSLEENFFPRKSDSVSRHIALYSSVYNYPGTLLIEFFYQEYQKLFAHISTTFEMINFSFFQIEDRPSGKINRYMSISKKVFVELKRLQIRLQEMEKTESQAQFIFTYDSRMRALKRFADSMEFFYNLSAKYKFHKSLLPFFKKTYETLVYILSEMIEDKKIPESSVSPLFEVWDGFSKSVIHLRDSGELDPEICSEIQIEALRMVESVKVFVSE